MTLKHIIEALVFASQKPLTPKEIVQVLRSAAEGEDPEVLEFAKVKEDVVVAALEELKNTYLEAGNAFRLVDQVSGWHIVTAPECGKWVRQLYPESKPARLSGPALETLAIVAYRQPITKADIEAVRGVAVDGMMQTLLEKSLIRIAGRADVPGRPLLYETTEHFLEHFGLKGVDELPNSAELRRANLPTAPIETQAPAPETPKQEAEKELPLDEAKAEAAEEAITQEENPEAAEETSAPEEETVEVEEPAEEESPAHEEPAAEEPTSESGEEEPKP